MVDQELMSKTSDNTAVFMHCLPAKIGSEVSNDVIKDQSQLF
jgi:ornithine carbamoyltransferase